MPKRTKQVDFPKAVHPFLNDAMAPFRKRARAIRFGGGAVDIQRVIERNGQEEIEKIEIALKSSLGPQVALSLWSDRWIWIHAGHLSKQGWIWEWTKDGRLVGPNKEIEVCRKAEMMLNFVANAAPDAISLCESLWSSVIASGPRSV